MRGGRNKGYAPRFEEVTAFPGRTAAAAKWSDLRRTRRADKPWLDGLPRLIFLSDMGDSLSNAVSFEYLTAEIISAVTSPAGQRHVWQWLTKRPSRMAKFSEWLDQRGMPWPANLWAGTTITSMSTLGRIPHLLKVGTAETIRFLSVEPQIEPIRFGRVLGQLDWVIQGGESGGNARPFDLEWARELRDECVSSNTAFFLKQLGSHATLGATRVKTRDRHGGDWSEWPADLRVRQLPTPRRVTRHVCGGRRYMPLVQSDAAADDGRRP